MACPSADCRSLPRVGRRLCGHRRGRRCRFRRFGGGVVRRGVRVSVVVLLPSVKFLSLLLTVVLAVVSTTAALGAEGEGDGVGVGVVGGDSSSAADADADADAVADSVDVFPECDAAASDSPPGGEEEEEEVEEEAENGVDPPTAAAGEAVSVPPLPPLERTIRFPSRGTDEYDRLCPWTSLRTSEDWTPPSAAGFAGDGPCVMLARPSPKWQEGLSAWMLELVRWRIVAIQAGCDLVLDYGPGVDVRSVLEPADPSSPGGDWTIPDGYECDPRDRCAYLDPDVRRRVQRLGVPTLIEPPQYRFAYSGGTKSQWIYEGQYRRLEEAIPGFEVENGFACAMGDLMRLSSRASEYEPRLFDELLPAVRDEGALVMAIHLRTFYSDAMARVVERGQELKKKDYTEGAAEALECAERLEERHLSSGGENYSRVVWTVLSDSPDLKGWVKDNYGGEGKAGKGGTHDREVLTTGSRGKHTRTKAGPSTADFAEAVIDWYLLGESDLVLATEFSFGHTGALRTSRPVYDAKTCDRLKLVHDASEMPTPDEIRDKMKKMMKIKQPKNKGGKKKGWKKQMQQKKLA